MRLNRRTMLKGSALAGAAVAVPLAATQAQARLVVFDSRIAESRAFAAQHSGFTAIDIAHAEAAQWKELREASGHARVEGLTAWSDWVAVRGAMQEKGLRMASETRAQAPISGRTQLFRWSMKAR